jgi:hypothetical protein
VVGLAQLFDFAARHTAYGIRHTAGDRCDSTSAALLAPLLYAVCCMLYAVGVVVGSLLV